MNRNIYIDCTDTVVSRLKTGIQRTVNSIVKVAGQSTAHDAYPVISCIGNYYRYNPGSSLYFAHTLSDFFKFIRNVLALVHARFKPQEIHLQDSPSGNKKSLVSVLPLLAICRTIMSLMFWCAFQLDGAFVGRKMLVMRDEDILFLPDLFWKSDLEAAICRCNAIKILLIYDVIALDHPEFFEDIQVMEFGWHLERVLGQVEGVMTISLSEMNNILKYSQRNNKNLIHDYNHLGHDFSESSTATACSVSGVVSEVFSKGGSVYLMVGTIEPRKNHVLALSAFRKLWEKGYNVTLCIIGQIGWKCDEMVAAIRSDPHFGTRLFLLTNALDDELEYAYRNCKAVVCASHAEGFGLPLVEAMHFGKPVLASDIPVFREIGREYALFFSLSGPSELISAVERIEEGESVPGRPPAWPTWQESVDKLFSKLLTMAKQIDDKRCSAQVNICQEFDSGTN